WHRRLKSETSWADASVCRPLYSTSTYSSTRSHFATTIYELRGSVIVPDGLPGPGEVLVRIRLSPIQPADFLALRGPTIAWPVKADELHVPRPQVAEPMSIRMEEDAMDLIFCDREEERRKRRVLLVENKCRLAI